MQIKSVDQISDQVITILWDDDHQSIYFADHLRANCPCALCANRKKSGGPIEAPQQIKITEWRVTGRYAVEFRFSDGHKTGIYPFDLLRELCQCDLCDQNTIRIQGPLV